jgi:hypothetical protein
MQLSPDDAEATARRLAERRRLDQNALVAFDWSRATRPNESEVCGQGRNEPWRAVSRSRASGGRWFVGYGKWGWPESSVTR